MGNFVHSGVFNRWCNPRWPPSWGSKTPWCSNSWGRRSSWKNGSIKSTRAGNFIKRQMKKDIVQIDLAKPVPNDVEALVILGPDGAYTDLDLYHLDQFILRGKSVAVFEKTWDVSVANIEAADDIAGEDKPGYTALLETSDSLQKLLAHFGIQVNTDLVMEPFQHEPILLTQWQTFRGRLTPAGQGVSPYPLLPIFQELNRGKPVVHDPGYLVPALYEFLDPSTARRTLRRSARPHVPRRDCGPGDGLQGMPFFPLRICDGPETGPHGKTPVVALATGTTESYFKGRTNRLERKERRRSNRTWQRCAWTKDRFAFWSSGRPWDSRD